MLCESIAADKFVTFFCGVLDVASRTFRYCNAGHPYPMLVSSGAVRALDQGAAVLGLFPAWTYQDSSVGLRSDTGCFYLPTALPKPRRRMAKNSA